MLNSLAIMIMVAMILAYELYRCNAVKQHFPNNEPQCKGMN